MMQVKVTAAELPNLLDRAPGGIRVLSLDCFDTLIWRNVEAPHDIFADLPIAGGGAWVRTRAESKARKTAWLAEERAEVTIDHIYRTLMPSASHAERAAAIAAELAAEARHAFAFAPVVALIRAAKARGLEVIVVSDTYLAEDQLRALIASAAGDEVANLIDRIFCSSAFGKTKATGLFEPVLAALGVPAGAVLHVGDNAEADQNAPAGLGVATAHFRQFDHFAQQRLRLEAAAATMIDGRIRADVPAYQPHRPAVALREETDAAWTLGHDVLGPVFQAFAAWVQSEAAEIATRTGRPVKPVFLLRDGHLPARVFEAMTGTKAATAEISRFTARRATFTGEAAVSAYLATQAKHGRVDVLARQLGLTDSEARALGTSQDAFSRAALQPAALEKIVARSTAFADRLFAHLRAAGVERGDAVLFVDLGYNGTAQNQLAPVLAERFDLHVAGRYLLLREEILSGLDKKGFLDARHYDARALHALSGPIAVIEQLSTCPRGSVVDYGPKGDPIRKGGGTKSAQNAIRDRIQEACIAFARQPRAGMDRPPASDDADCRRHMAAGVLGRLLFMPSAEEVALLEAFEHDINLGTKDSVRLLDVERAAEGMRRRGLFYLHQGERMYLSGEIQPYGLPTALALLGANRFDLDLRNADFRGPALTLPVMLADARGQAMIEVEAHATHDGFYLATVPVGAGRFAVGINFGAVCDWVQIDECAFHPVAAFGPRSREIAVAPIPAQPVREGMSEEGPGLFRCGPEALLLAPPPQNVGATPYLLALAFRPLVLKDRAALKKAA